MFNGKYETVEAIGKSSYLTFVFKSQESSVTYSISLSLSLPKLQPSASRRPRSTPLRTRSFVAARAPRSAVTVVGAGAASVEEKRRRDKHKARNRIDVFI